MNDSNGRLLILKKIKTKEPFKPVNFYHILHLIELLNLVKL